MLKKVIINADDFGLSKNVNNAILSLALKNNISSVSVMANEAYINTDELNNLSRAGISIGCHLSIIQGKPLLDQKSIPSLINEHSKSFYSDYKQFVIKYCMNKISTEHIYNEWKQQLNTLKKMNINISHLDSHQHIHMLPGLFKIALQLQKEFHIKRIRIPYSGILFNKILKVDYFILQALTYKHYLNLKSKIYCISLSHFSNLSLKKIEKKLLTIPNELTKIEIISHPGNVFNKKQNQKTDKNCYDNEEKLLELNEFKLLLTKYHYKLVNKF